MLPTTRAIGGQISTGLPTREQIVRLQSEMMRYRCELPPPEHIFHPGWYERRQFVPAGILVVGKIHLHSHPVGLLFGRSIVISEFGRQEVRAGYFDVSPPGVKRVVLAIEDSLFFTLHRNPHDSQDLAQLEAEHIEPEAMLLAAKSVEVLQ